MSAGDDDLGALGGLADLYHIDLQALTLRVGLAPDLLVDAQIGVGKFRAGADAHRGRTVAGVDAGDHAGEQLVLLGGELVVHHALLSLPDALDDDLPGGLSGDAAKALGLDLDADHVPQLGAGEGGLGLGQADLAGGVVHLLHHVLFQEHPDGVGLRIGVYHQVVAHALVVPPVGGHQRLGDLFHHVAGLDALFLLDLSDGGKKLLAVQLIIVDLLGRFLSHDRFLLTLNYQDKPQKRG